MRQKDVWHLKFRDSEIYMWCHISEFNLLEAQQAEKSQKGRLNITFRPQIAASLVAEFVVWAADSAMVQICWLRVWLFCGFWFEFWMILRVFARIYGAGFSNYARTWSVYYESDSEWRWCSVLMRIASNFEFHRLLGISKAWCDAIGFLGEIQTNKMKRDFIKGWIFTNKKPIWQRTNPSALQYLSYTTTYIYRS